jgi:hypothetical protein
MHPNDSMQAAITASNHFFFIASLVVDFCLSTWWLIASKVECNPQNSIECLFEFR